MLLAQKRAAVNTNITYTLVNRSLVKSTTLSEKLAPLPTRVMELEQFHGLSALEFSKYDVVLVGVKPTQLNDLLNNCLQLKHFSGEVISTLAGVTIETLQLAFAKASIHSRLMPSIVMAEFPSTALMFSSNPDKSFLTTWYKQPVGDLLKVKSDLELDQLTLIFGSNAAYISALIQPWIENLAKFHSKELATKLTFEQWSAALQFLKGKDLPEVISQVKTPGGITAQALLTLDDEKYSLTIFKAIGASSNRAGEVGELVNRDLSSSNHLLQK